MASDWQTSIDFSQLGGSYRLFVYNLYQFYDWQRLWIAKEKCPLSDAIATKRRIMTFTMVVHHLTAQTASNADCIISPVKSRKWSKRTALLHRQS